MESRVIDVGLSVNELDKKANTSPIKALKEIVWNAFDADATQVSIDVEIDTNMGEAIDGIIIKDNGHGLHYDNIDIAFSNYGESEKKTKYKSPSGRIYHGKMGEGRYAYFALGNNIIWESVFKDDKNTKTFKAIFNNARKKQVEITDVENTKNSCGLTVKISSIIDKYKLDNKKVEESFLSEFAPYLLANKDISLKYENKILDINNHIQLEQDFKKKFASENKSSIDASVKIIL